MSKLNVNQISSLSGGNISLDGQVTGTSATFSGNVSIGGSLTFDKVTNVDSVGLITAKDGIQVLANGINATGVITATSFSGDGSQLSNISGGGEFDFVASGTIPNGQTVIIKDDGTVGIVTQTSVAPSVGSSTVYETSSVSNGAGVVAYDSTNGKVVVAYAANTQKGYAVVGAVTGMGITFGSPVEFNQGSNVSAEKIVYDYTNEKVVIVYTDQGNSNYGTAIVGTVSGTSISFGAKSVFKTTNSGPHSLTHDPDQDKIVIAFCDNGSSTHGKAIVGNIVGTDINFTGSETTFKSDQTGYPSIVYDLNENKVVVFYQDVPDSQKGKAKVGTVSGDTISFPGSEYEFKDGRADFINSVYDSVNSKVVTVYEHYSNSVSTGRAIVGTVTGTGITFGSETVFTAPNNFNTIKNPVGYDPDKGQVIISYRNTNNSNAGSAIVGTVSGTSIGFGSTVVYNTDQCFEPTTTYDTVNKKAVIIYRNSDNSNYGEAVVFDPGGSTTNLTAGNYIGIAKNSIADGATGKINIPTGINTSQSGLTTGRTYYVQEDGTLSTTAGNPSVVAGTSISDTDLLIK